MRGLNVRFNPLNRESSAPNGQKRWHHFGSSKTSIAMMAGNASTVQVVSPNANSRMTKSTVANVRPMGQIRQNTGKPNTSVDPSAAAKMPWRLSILMPLALPQGAVHAKQAERDTIPGLLSRSEADAAACAADSPVCATWRAGATAGPSAAPHSAAESPAAPQEAAGSSATLRETAEPSVTPQEEAATELEPAPSSAEEPEARDARRFPFFFPRAMKCTGHAQAQNTLPNTTHTASTASTLTTAIGMAARSAIIAKSAPRGHRSVMVSNPMPQKLPMPPAVKYPTATTASTASMMRNRSRALLNFFIFLTPPLLRWAE